MSPRSARSWTPCPSLRRRPHRHGRRRRCRPGSICWWTTCAGGAPQSSVNRPIGSDRRLAIIRSNLSIAKEIAHAHHAKINDVLLAAVARGYRALLQARGERVEDLVLRAFVPVSLHQEQPGEARGNVDAGMVVPLPIGEPDDVRLLERIAAESAARKT